MKKLNKCNFALENTVEAFSTCTCGSCAGLGFRCDCIPKCSGTSSAQSAAGAGIYTYEQSNVVNNLNTVMKT